MRSPRPGLQDDFEDDGEDDFEVDVDPYLPQGQPLHSPRARAQLRHLEESLSGPAQIDAALAALSGEAILLLRLVAEIGRLLPLSFIAEEGALLLGAARCAAAFGELLKHRLLIGERYYGLDHAGLPASIATPLLPALPPLDPPRPGPPLPQRVPQALVQLPFELSLLVVALWTVRPKRTVAGPLYRRDEERLSALLGPSFPLPERLGQLQQLGLCSGSEVLTVSTEAAAQLSAMGPADLIRSFAAGIFHGPRQPLLALLLSGAAEGKPDAWFARAQLERALRVGYLQRGVYFHRHAHLHRSVADELGRLVRFVGLEHKEHGGEALYRLWPLLGHKAGEPQKGRIHLQPNFEILLPPDAPAPTLLGLGRAAELKKADQIVTLLLNRASIARAADSGLSAEEIIAVLKEHATTQVPQNVEAQVRGWAGQAGQARFAEGLLLVLAGEAARLAVLDPGLKRLLGPSVGQGVYLLAERDKNAVEKRLRTLEVPPADGVLRMGDGEDAWRRVRAPGRQQPVQPPPAAKAGPLYERVTALRGDLSPAQLEHGPQLSLPAEPAIAAARTKPALPAAPTALAAHRDEIPAALRFAALPPQLLELTLRNAIREGRPVYLQIAGEAAPWVVRPQRLSHRGRRSYLEAYRDSKQEYRVLPLEMILQLGLPPEDAEP